MEKQNITLSLPRETIKKLKHIAVDKNTSISRLVTQALEEIVRKEERYKLAKTRQIMLLEKGLEMDEVVTRKRDDLHER